MLIGIDYYWTFISGKFQQLHEFHNLVMLESVFGWILSGSVNADGTRNHVINTIITHVLQAFATDRHNYENDVKKFWDLKLSGFLRKNHLVMITI